MKTKVVVKSIYKRKGKVPGITLTLLPISGYSTTIREEKTMEVKDPTLIDKFKVGQEFYVDYQF